MGTFQGRTALVTGGASGIGEATARRLAAGGARVVIADIDGDGAKDVAASIGGMAVHVDVADTAWVREAVASAEAALGPIDVLINNAGEGSFAFFVDTNEADWDDVLRVNLRGVMAATHAVLPGMIARRQGAIVNTASEAGRVGTVAGACYAAAKAGVIGFTKAIAREAAPFGVRCNAVAPGPIETPLLNGSAARAGRFGERIKQGMIDATVLGRVGRPAEAAAAIVFLASEDASYITGETLAVSGGVSMI